MPGSSCKNNFRIKCHIKVPNKRSGVNNATPTNRYKEREKATGRKKCLKLEQKTRKSDRRPDKGMRNSVVKYHQLQIGESLFMTRILSLRSILRT